MALIIASIKEIIALMAIWVPELGGRRGPKYLQIVEALTESITAGALRPGDRLPPHRELAYQLGLSPNTTSRAYGEAVNRALIRGEIGRGTFVRGPSSPPVWKDRADLRRVADGPIDLSRNLPLPGLAGAALTRSCAAMGASGGLEALADYQTDADLERHQAAARTWIAHHGLETCEEVMTTNGAQHGIFCALTALTEPSGLLLVQPLCYQPVIAMARNLGLKLATLACDADGPCPQDLDRLCRERMVSAIYLTPTLDTPTGRTMSAARRADLAEVIRAHGACLIEDDVFALYQPERPAPIATLVPEQTIYVTSVSKCLAPGLRVGFVHAPQAVAARLRAAINLTVWMTPPITADIVSRWMRDGTASQLADAQISASVERQALAKRILKDYLPATPAAGLHLWLTLPEGWTADLMCMRAARRGVLLANGTAFAVPAPAGSGTPASGTNAVRISLGHEADTARVESGLTILKSLLDAGPEYTEPWL